MQRFPTRTLVLMGLSLVAFAWMYLNTHRAPGPTPRPPVMQLIRADDGGLP